MRENDFEAFWVLYDLKKNKVKSKALFMKMSNTDFEDMRTRVKHYVNNTNTDGSFPSRMNPTTYLNPTNKLWMDEVKIVTQVSNNRAKTQEQETAERYGVWTA